MLDRDDIRLAEVADRAGLAARVPTCPGWQLGDLLRHLGGVHRRAAAYVANERVAPYPADEEAAFFVAVGEEELVDWFRSGHRAAGRHADRG